MKLSRAIKIITRIIDIVWVLTIVVCAALFLKGMQAVEPGAEELIAVTIIALLIIACVVSILLIGLRSLLTIINSKK